MDFYVIPKEEFQQFKQELIDEIRRVNSPDLQSEKRWLKGKEVKQLLGISEGKLKTMRDKGVINAEKILGVYYYDYNQIQELLTKI